ncbi:MAG: 50S ribosomal protein L32 [Candidatus Vogelbacteria bacterium]|nr:50S ribosomal protein L32 [Candidatus Vogelbacteria bacterium]
MRHTREHTANRRSHHAIVAPRLSTCGKCDSPKQNHRVCLNCGSYNKREVINVLVKVEKKEAKRKKKAVAEGK